MEFKQMYVTVKAYIILPFPCKVTSDCFSKADSVSVFVFESRSENILKELNWVFSL